MKVEVKDNECFIPKEALALANFASKDGMSRPVLTGLHIANGVAETADGFATGCYEVIQGENFPECVIRMDDILHAGLKNVGTLRQKQEGVFILKTESGFIIKGKYQLITEPIIDKFPKTDQLYGYKEDEVVAYLGLSVLVLKNLITTLKQSDNKMVLLKIRKNKENKFSKEVVNHINSAVEFSSLIGQYKGEGNGKLQGLIMPCFVDGNNTDWKSDKFKKEK